MSRPILVSVPWPHAGVVQALPREQRAGVDTSRRGDVGMCHDVLRIDVRIALQDVEQQSFDRIDLSGIEWQEGASAVLRFAYPVHACCRLAARFVTDLDAD